MKHENSANEQATPAVEPKRLGFFLKNGFHYEQVKRTGNFAIYKQRLSPGRGCLAYEVIRVRVRPKSDFNGMTIPAHEYAPSNEEFGHHGWSFPTLERAEAKFADMVKAAEEKAKAKA